MKNFSVNTKLWLFTLGTLSIISFMIIYNNSLDELGVGGVLINLFSFMLLFSLVVVVIGMGFIDKYLKLITLIVGITLVVFSMSSCRSTRSGCPDTWNMIGYR